jgi:hypothetical protein
MNQFFFESRGREKVREALDEGLRSQAYHRARGRSINLPKLLMIVLSILGILAMLVR